MTLRSDIHAAVDASVPPAPWLAASISDSIAASRGGKRPSSMGRQRPWMSGLRGAGVLAAVLIVVLLVVGVLSGGQLWRDWGAFGGRIAPATGIDQNVLAQLRARPLHLPVVTEPYAYTSCGEGPTSIIDAPQADSKASAFRGTNQNVLGNGPVYGNGGTQVKSTQWGNYYDIVFITKVGTSGPILIRGGEFGSGRSLVFVGAYAAGPVVGTDTIDGKKVEQHSELVIDPSHPGPGTTTNGKFIVWPVRQGAAPGNSPCYGFQVDGPGFSETYVAWGDLV